MATLSNNTTNDKSMNGLVTIDANSISTDELDVDTLVVNLSGTAPTVSVLSNDTNIATTAWVTNHASSNYVTIAGTQTVTGEKTFSNANTFISGNTVTNDIVSASATSNINIGSAQTSGILNIGTGTSRTGAINIGTGATATSTAISIGNQTGAFGSCDIGTTTITVGKANTATNSMQTSTNGTLNLKTTSTGGNVNLGTGMTSGTITIGGGASSATNILIGSSQTTYTGSIAIGTVVVGNAPITIGSSSSTTQTATHNALTTFKKLVVVDDGILLRLGFSATGLTMGKTGTNEITFKLLDSLDTLYFNGSTGANIMYLNSTEIVNSIPTTFSSTTTHTGTATFNNNILIQQSTYPSTNTSQLGYTLTVAGSAGNTTTNVWKTLNQIDVPSKGVWLFVGLYELDVVAGQPGDIEQLRFGLSSVAPVSFTRVSNIEYYREADDTVSLNDIRDRLQVSGVFTTLASATYYFSARLRYTGFSATDLQTKGNSTLTRIG
jgi:hypothetical protein